MPWRRPVHERLTAAAAAQLGFSAVDAKRLVQGNLDNDLSANLLGTYRRQWGNDYQPAHCLRKREHVGDDADRQALAAAMAFVLSATLQAWQAQAVGDRRRALFWGGKALHTVQDSYFHADRNAGGEVTHVRRYLGRGADHDAAIDAGWDRQGNLSVQYRGAERAGLAYLRLLQFAFAATERSTVTEMIRSFCAEHFRLASQA
jgi:hypothetical protein